MTLFGIIWLFIILYAFIKKDIFYMSLVTIIGMIWQSTNMVTIESFSCGPQLITSILFIVKSYLYFWTKKAYVSKLELSKKNIINSWILFAIYVVFNILFVVEEVTLSYVISSVTLFIYIFTFYRMYKVSISFDNKKIRKIIDCVTIIILLFGAFQLFVNVFNIPKENFLGNLIFNDYNSDIYYFRDSLRFYSTFMEPSYVAGLLIALIIYYLNEDKGKYLYCGLLLIALLITFSSTAYLTFTIIIVIYFLNSKKTKNLIFIVLLSMVGILLLGTFTNILDDVIFNKLNTGSGIVRSRMNSKAFEMFQMSPYFGNGYQSTRASSIIYDILAELGIFGLFIYFIPIFICLKTIFSSKYSLNDKKYYYMVVAMMVSLVIACPDINLCSFWLVMYIFALSPEKDKEGDKLYEENRNFNVS